MSWRMFPRFLVAALLVLSVSGPLAAETMTIKDETPAVTVDVPSGFESKSTDRGLQAKTPDGDVYVWFETYQPEERDALIKEHDDYWAKNGVTIGDQSDRFEKTIGATQVIATDYKGASWNGKPTVLRYLFIDAGLPSKKLILMSLWASPDGDKAHDADITSMISSLKMKE